MIFYLTGNSNCVYLLIRRRRLWLSLFLSALDGTIVSTALIDISNELKALNQSSWVVVAYFLTYNGTLLITMIF